MYYKNTVGEFKDLLLSETTQQTYLMLKAGAATVGAEVSVLFETDEEWEEEIIKQAGEAVELYAQEVRDTDSTSRPYRLRRALRNRRAEPEINRASAEQALCNGGALLQLTVRPCDTSAYYYNLDELLRFHGRRTETEEE